MRTTKIMKNTRIPRENQKNYENHTISFDYHEKNENLQIPNENHENYENHRIPVENQHKSCKS